MKAGQLKVEEFLSSNKTQFIIPVYQRNYDWTTTQCKQLLDDILEAGNNKNIKTHFIGSMVYIHDDVYTSSRIKELIIIDGQQRITTLILIYLALYHLARDLNNNNQEDIYETFLVNKFVKDEIHRFKLRPTDNNKEALESLMQGEKNTEYRGYSRLIENFYYFKTRIVEENFETVLKGLSKLIFVEISLERDKDDPHRIFESLNSTGLDLTEADLIRNYILMGLEANAQNLVYNKFWKEIEKYAKNEESNKSLVSDFIRDYLTVENNKIPNKDKVYLEFKSKYPFSTVEELKELLTKIKGLAKHYNKLINPNREGDNEISEQLKYINRLEINVAYPFLIRVYDDYAVKTIDKHTFIEILKLIQSYTWRRFIAGVPTNSLNKTFMSLYDKIDQENYLLSIQKSLLQRTGAQRFPRNDEVIESLRIKDVYNIKSKNRTYFFERLENHKNKEEVKIEGNPEITIEHIFPRNPNISWNKELGDVQYNEIKSNYLHTVGNLTLTGYNSELSNKYFTLKRELFKDSRLWLNQHLANIEKWDKSEIEKRFEIIAERFLEIWEIPDVEISDIVNGEEVNIFEAEEPKNKKLDYAIFFDEKLNVKNVTELYIEIISQLFDLEPERFFNTELAERIDLTKSEEDLRQSKPINDSYYIESNIDSNFKFYRIKLALEIFNLEEELFIKYQDTND